MKTHYQIEVDHDGPLPLNLAGMLREVTVGALQAIRLRAKVQVELKAPTAGASTDAPRLLPADWVAAHAAAAAGMSFAGKPLRDTTRDELMAVAGFVMMELEAESAENESRRVQAIAAEPGTV
jgi:hypothetical protein